jgi:acetyl-CoA carboxylase carboxyl transferase subunit beta
MSIVKTSRPGIKQPKDLQGGAFVAPEGFWLRCTECHAILQQAAVAENHQVCTECGHHFRMNARKRIDMISDKGSFVEMDKELKAKDVLGFYDSKSYEDRLKLSMQKTRLNDAFISGSAKIKGRSVELGAFEFSFMGGSMGMVVGEKVARLFDRAAKNNHPAIVFHASGGARMQEGLLSLMQMAKTTVSLTQLREKGIPYISVLTDPTTGGVAASFAMLGDVHVAEPAALIGFAGPRVIQQTINQKLPDNFQRAEFLLEHGMIDAIVPRQELRNYLHRMVTFLMDDVEDAAPTQKV